MAKLDNTLESFRKVLHEGRDELAWEELIDLVDLAWDTQRDHSDVWLSYLLEHLESWPDEVRVCPDHFLEMILEGAGALAPLMRRTCVYGAEQLDQLWRLHPELQIHELVLQREMYGVGKISEERLVDIFVDPRLEGVERLFLDGQYLGLFTSRALANAEPLRGVTFLSVRESFFSAFEEAAQHMPLLEGLASSGSHMGDDGAAKLAASGLIEQLRFLELRGNNIQHGGMVALANSGGFAKLERLDLSRNRLTDAGVEAWCRGLESSNLKELSLGHTGLTGGGASALAAAPALRGLARLVLNGNDIRGEGLRELAGSPLMETLNSLNLCSNRMGDEDAGALAEGFGEGALQYLYLSGNRIGDAGVEALSKCTALSGLDSLYLDGNLVGPKGVRAVVLGAWSVLLSALQLSGNLLGDEGAEILAAADLPRLTSLGAAGNGIGDKGAEALVQRSLSWFKLSFNPISKATAARLKIDVERWSNAGPREDAFWAMIETSRRGEPVWERLSDDDLQAFHAWAAAAAEDIAALYYDGGAIFEHTDTDMSEDGIDELAQATVGLGRRDFYRSLATFYAHPRYDGDGDWDEGRGHSPGLEARRVLMDRGVEPDVY